MKRPAKGPPAHAGGSDKDPDKGPPAHAGGSDKKEQLILKRCPTCNKTFTDRNLSFCIDDGTPLVPVDDPPDEFTAVSPSARESESRLEGSPTANGEETAPPYQPPGTYAPPGVPPAKRSVWPWILGLLLLLLLVIGGIGAGAWFYFQPLKYVTANTNTSNTNANVDRSDINSNSNNSNSGSPVGNQNVNDNSDASENAPPPADESVVLADLTNLEHEWTVANINADKQKLNRILADDYVGVSAEGKAQAKAEYLRTVTRDTTVQKWEFDDLKVNLKGDRATLTGILRLRIQDQDVMYRFVDKFVWRDGRWQATGSEVELVKQTAL